MKWNDWPIANSPTHNNTYFTCTRRARKKKHDGHTVWIWFSFLIHFIAHSRHFNLKFISISFNLNVLSRGAVRCLSNGHGSVFLLYVCVCVYIHTIRTRRRKKIIMFIWRRSQQYAHYDANFIYIFSSILCRNCIQFNEEIRNPLEWRESKITRKTQININKKEKPRKIYMNVSYSLTVPKKLKRRKKLRTLRTWRK